VAVNRFVSRHSDYREVDSWAAMRLSSSLRGIIGEFLLAKPEAEMERLLRRNPCGADEWLLIVVSVLLAIMCSLKREA